MFSAVRIKFFWGDSGIELKAQGHGAKYVHPSMYMLEGTDIKYVQARVDKGAL